MDKPVDIAAVLSTTEKQSVLDQLISQAQQVQEDAMNAQAKAQELKDILENLRSSQQGQQLLIDQLVKNASENK